MVEARAWRAGFDKAPVHAVEATPHAPVATFGKAETGYVGLTCCSARPRATSHTTSSEHVYRPRSGDDASADPRASRNDALLPRTEMDVLSVQGNSVGTFDHKEVLVEFVNMLLRVRVRVALPKGDLGSVGAVENIPLDVGRVLRRRRNPIRSTLHETRERMHFRANNSASSIRPSVGAIETWYVSGRGL